MTALFALATTMPLALTALAAVWGGVLVVAAVLSMTVLVHALDALTRAAPPPLRGAEFPAGRRLSAVIGAGQLALLPLVVAALCGDWLSMPEKLGLAWAAGLWLGQVGNANAHELIHRPRAWARRLGAACFVSLLYGHHASAHPKVHHVWVASPRDPATAQLGESFYAYAPRAWVGSFREGHRAEARLLRMRHGARWRRHDPYIVYTCGAAVWLALAFAIGGLAGIAWYAGLSGFAQVQILLSDYVQHYGLRRAEVAHGRLEPVGPRHSWDAPQWYSGAMMLNAPRHADHHAHPARAFHELSLSADGPMLPRSLPAMATLALWPRGWRRAMDRRARKWAMRAAPPPAATDPAVTGQDAGGHGRVPA